MNQTSENKTYYIATFGCALNKADSLIIDYLLQNHGMKKVESPSVADVVIVNTCTVKGATERKIIHYLDRLQQNAKRFVIAGCMAYNRSFLERRYGQVKIYSPSEVTKVLEIVKEKAKVSVSEKYELPIVSSERIVQIPANDGCTSKCTFCATKLARPVLRSYNIERIIQNVRNAVFSGAFEVQLTSQDLGAYGLDRGTDLIKLLESLSGIAGSYMIRLGMMNPVHLKRFYTELPQFLNRSDLPMGGPSSRAPFYRFLHIPIQSGSDRVLRHMQRGNTAEEFIEMINYLRKNIEDMAVSTDVIVAYPIEDETDFELTRELLKKVMPEVVNVSRYSPMKGTVAASLRQIDSRTAAVRSREMSELVREIARDARKKYLKKRVKVFVTEKNKTLTGRMLNYLQVALPEIKMDKLGRVIDVKIDGLQGSTLIGSEA